MVHARKRRVWPAVLWLAAFTFLAGEAAAQVSPFRRVGLNLTKEDFALVEAAAAKLYAVENPKIGNTETWSSDKSKISGTVVLIAIYTWNSLPCRRVSHQIVAANRKDPYSIQIDRCRVTSGEWKIRY